MTDRDRTAVIALSATQVYASGDGGLIASWMEWLGMKSGNRAGQWLPQLPSRLCRLSTFSAEILRPVA